MAKDNAIYGDELISWTINEYHAHSRGMWWYIAAAAAGVALLIYAVATHNFLFAFIIIMFGIISVTHSLRPPAQYRFVVQELGVSLGSRFYPWKDIERFWIAYEPPEIKTLYFEFAGLRPRLPVPLEDADPNEVRKTLREFLAEDTSKTDEPLSDWLARVLKI